MAQLVLLYELQGTGCNYECQGEQLLKYKY